MRIVAVFVLFLVLSGCSVSGSKFVYSSVGETENILYFYRTPGFFMAGASPILSVNDSIIGPLRRGRSYIVPVEGQSCKVSVTDNPNDLVTWNSEKQDINFEIDLSNVNERFYEFKAGFSGMVVPIGPAFVPMGTNNYKFVEQKKDEALPRLHKTKTENVE